MNRLCLAATLVLCAACQPEDQHRLLVRFINETTLSQKVVVEGTVLERGSEPKFDHTLAFNETITAPALGQQAITVQHPTLEEALPIYEGSTLTLQVFTLNRLLVDEWEGSVPARDVECRVVREGAPEGSEGSLGCDAEDEPTQAASRLAHPGVRGGGD